MQRYLLLFVCGGMLAAASCKSSSSGEKAAESAATHAGTATAKGTAVMSFEKMTHDFGRIVEGEKVEYSFKFTNTGDKDLIILNATSSCGCTVPEWPKEPVKPGASGYMKVIFDSHGKDGYTEKAIHIQANTNPPDVEGPSITCTVVKG
ncbi:DUF1573 domain-containing protein [Chitinophaga pendula]|uniref:DUF1573 domain-containing protein n=1 Tax=Chitinophaga TaxID=79328 RepID=UPI000BAF53CA|nr:MULTISPECIES: DUF1573 domain-containing protein [Chitinophaga]ASZ15105.1 hypothetical protein CK934_25165 [Chitinophaga sp. MD30]UCJ08366.1 DUF1573 domain-containing protein [Chitinophaga pendula]